MLLLPVPQHTLSLSQHLQGLLQNVRLLSAIAATSRQDGCHKLYRFTQHLQQLTKLRRCP